jgi:hypothetical protein
MRLVTNVKVRRVVIIEVHRDDEPRNRLISGTAFLGPKTDQEIRTGIGDCQRLKLVETGCFRSATRAAAVERQHDCARCGMDVAACRRGRPNGVPFNRAVARTQCSGLCTI